MSKKFTELNAGTIGAGSIFAQAQEPALSGDPYTSTKVSATQMANYVAKGQAFPELDNHTIIQALTGGSGAGTVILTMAQYLALTPAQQTDGHIYVISDFACLFCYGRQYRAMQKLTQAEYNQLSTAEKNDGTLYIITDAATSIGDADDVDLTGLAAGNILRAVSDGQGGLIFKPFVFTDLTPNDVSSSVTKFTNIDYFEKSVIRSGNVVCVYISFSFSSTPTANNIIAENLPKAAANMLMLCECTSGSNNGKASRVMINTYGRVLDWYTTGFFGTGMNYSIIGSYITNDPI